MAHMPGSPNNNHKTSLGMSAKIGFNNISKKNGQGKKLVIKNRRGTHTHTYMCVYITYYVFTFRIV